MKRKVLFSLICLMIILTIGQVSYAAVEIVPSKNGAGTDAIVNTTISNSYLMCQGMKDFGGSLYGTTVSPHLATNKDWGAVSYLSNSIYGTNTTGKANGIEVTIDGVKYYSTTTNITGVMNWGSNPNATRYTQTAGLLSNYDPDTSTASSYVTEIYANKDTSFVELIGSEYSQLGMALSETQSLYGGNYWVNNSGNNVPISIRKGLFGFGVANSFSYALGFDTSGAPSSSITFRPVIWN